MKTAYIAIDGNLRCLDIRSGVEKTVCFTTKKRIWQHYQNPPWGGIYPNNLKNKRMTYATFCKLTKNEPNFYFWTQHNTNAIWFVIRTITINPTEKQATLKGVKL